MNNFDSVVTENQGLVHLVAGKFKNRGAEYEDLVQIGNIGLIKATKKFNEELGFKFSTFAVNVIIQEIRQYLRDNQYIKVSRSVYEINNKINYAKEKLKTNLMREPTIEEIGKETNLTTEEIVDAVNFDFRNILSFQNENLTLENKSFKNEDMFENKILINDLIDNLCYESKMVIKLRYFHDLTQTEVGKVMSISQVKVSRIEKKAIESLKRNFRE